MNRILLVEDEKILAKNVAFSLEKDGYSVDIAFSGEDGLEQYQQHTYDLLLLDWTLPGMDGLEVCRILRKESNIPIIMITAKEELVDRVVGLEVGADDYITKPFHQRELLARIRALLRRSQLAQTGSHNGNEEHRLTWNGLELDKDKLNILYEGRSAPLTGIEFKLLDLFIRHPQHVYTREFLFETVWGMSEGYNDRTVDVNISRLRRKIFELSGLRTLPAVRGIGYSFGERE
ncbi:MAG: response regulator transcription factor [Gorillibacterium sp.]|nr:response regulator transcription factor [Gorillibacterium sp.]